MSDNKQSLRTAIHLQQQDDLDGVIRRYEMLLAAQSHAPEVLANLASALRQAGQLDESIPPIPSSCRRR